jgi:hypothetical protein
VTKLPEVDFSTLLSDINRELYSYRGSINKDVSRCQTVSFLAMSEWPELDPGGLSGTSPDESWDAFHPKKRILAISRTYSEMAVTLPEIARICNKSKPSELSPWRIRQESPTIESWRDIGYQGDWQ